VVTLFTSRSRKISNITRVLLGALAVVAIFGLGASTSLAADSAHAHEKKIAAGEAPRNWVSHAARLFHFLGEVEVVFFLGGRGDGRAKCYPLTIHELPTIAGGCSSSPRLALGAQMPCCPSHKDR
jgi:hypothetical protein